MMKMVFIVVLALLASTASAQEAFPPATCVQTGWVVECDDPRMQPSEMPSLSVLPLVIAPPTPTKIERATVGTLFASSSVSMVPVWITAACTTAGTCREVNPVMRKLIGDGPVRAVAVKAAVSGLTHYAVWRFPAATKKQQLLRVTLAAVLLGVNTFDAVHDIRVLRRIEQRSR